MNAFLWAIVMLLVGLALLVMELFIPFAGTLGIVSALLICASVATVFYYEGLGPGTLYLVAVTGVIGLALVKGLHWWPHTRLGKLILNLPPDRGDTDPETILSPLDFLVGRIGLAKSKMLPSGVIDVEGKTYDAVSTGGPLEQGDPIQVVDVQGNRILIRPHEVSLPPTDSPSRDLPQAPTQQPDGPTADVTRVDADGGDVDTSSPGADLLIPDPFDDSLPEQRLP